MSRAGVAKPLPPKAPMALELGASAPPVKWAEVPLPPAPTARPAVAQARPSVAPAVGEASPPPAWAPPVFETPGAAPAQGAPQGANPNDPTVKFAADQTGVMLSVNQDLESDKVRQSWAAQGGQLTAYEVNAGMMLMFKDMSEQAANAYMFGVGLNGGFRLSILNTLPAEIRMARLVLPEGVHDVQIRYMDAAGQGNWAETIAHVEIVRGFRTYVHVTTAK